MKKITELSDDWFVENGYWKYTPDTSSPIGRYYNQNTNKFNAMMDEIFVDGIHLRPTNIKSKEYNDKTYTFRIITPAEVLKYLNDRHK